VIIVMKQYSIKQNNDTNKTSNQLQTSDWYLLREKFTNDSNRKDTYTPATDKYL